MCSAQQPPESVPMQSKGNPEDPAGQMVAQEEFEASQEAGKN